MIIKDLVQYMGSLGKTPKQIKKVLNNFLSRRKCPKLKVDCINLNITVIFKFFSKLGNQIYVCIDVEKRAL